MGMKFRKKDPEEVKEKERIARDIKQATEDTIQAAQACLESDLFLRYRIEYENLERSSIEALINIDKHCTDPVEYGFMCKDVVKNLKLLRSLITQIRTQAGQKSPT